jgi:phosphate-selective porin OprO and OprP
MLPRSVGSLRHCRIVAVAGFLAAFAAPLCAQEGQAPPAPAPAAPPNPLESRVKELEETVKQLQETIRQLQENAQKPQAPDKTQVERIVDDKLKQQKPLAGWQNGFSIQSADGANRLRVGGYLQAQSRAFTSSGGDTGGDSFFLRRARVILEGTVARNIDFRLMPDFGLGTTVLQDAYLDLNYLPESKLRFGKFKQPVSLERLQSGSELLFVERAISQNLQPNRDVGVQLFGDLAKGTISYQLGGFNGLNDGASSDGDVGDSKDFAGRVFVQPFKNQASSPLQGLGIGVAGSTGGRDNETVSNVNYRTSGRSTFFKYNQNVVASGTQSRLSPQFYYYWGPVGLMGEQVTSREDLLLGTTRGNVSNQAWFVQGSYVLTGEKASFRNITPNKPFDPHSGQWGAFELAARYGHVRVDPDAFSRGFADPTASASKANALTFGLNWYLNRAVKLQLNYERTNFDRAIKFGSDVRDHEDVFLSQFQVAF